jgi:hypothetical protein
MRPKPLKQYAEYLRINIERYIEDFEYNIHHSSLTEYVKSGEISGNLYLGTSRETKIAFFNYYKTEIEIQTRVSLMTFEEFYSQLKRDNKINSIIK